MNFKNRNGIRMKTTIDSFHKNQKITEQTIVDQVEQFTKDQVKGDTAGCIRTTLNLLRRGVLLVQDDLKVLVPMIEYSVLKQLKTKKEVGWLLTAETLRRGDETNASIIRLAQDYGVQYDPGTKNCIPAGVRLLYHEGLLEYLLV